MPATIASIASSCAANHSNSLYPHRKGTTGELGCCADDGCLWPAAAPHHQSLFLANAVVNAAADGCVSSVSGLSTSNPQTLPQPHQTHHQASSSSGSLLLLPSDVRTTIVTLREAHRTDSSAAPTVAAGSSKAFIKEPFDAHIQGQHRSPSKTPLPESEGCTHLLWFVQHHRDLVLTLFDVCDDLFFVSARDFHDAASACASSHSLAGETPMTSYALPRRGHHRSAALDGGAVVVQRRSLDAADCCFTALELLSDMWWTFHGQQLQFQQQGDAVLHGGAMPSPQRTAWLMCSAVWSAWKFTASRDASVGDVASAWNQKSRLGAVMVSSSDVRRAEWEALALVSFRVRRAYWWQASVSFASWYWRDLPHEVLQCHVTMLFLNIQWTLLALTLEAPTPPAAVDGPLGSHVISDDGVWPITAQALRRCGIEPHEAFEDVFLSPL